MLGWAGALRQSEIVGLDWRRKGSGSGCIRNTEKGLVVPVAAVLYDIHGDTWVYEDLGGNAYARRRIEVARHAGEYAVVTRGIGEGALVVTAGAAELFGTEFGAGH